MMEQEEKIGRCDLCGRIKILSSHHLIPVTLHKNKWFKKKYNKTTMKEEKISLCRDCHLFLHKHFAPKTLAREYNTLESLHKNVEVKKFVAFIRKKH